MKQALPSPFQPHPFNFTALGPVLTARRLPVVRKGETHLNEATPLVNDQGTTRISYRRREAVGKDSWASGTCSITEEPLLTFTSVGVSIGAHPSRAKEPGGDHLMDVLDFLVACGLPSISLTCIFL